MISPANLDKSKYVFTCHKTLTKEGFEQCRALPKDSVLVGCIGNVGKLGMVADDKSATNQQINALICNGSNDAHFVYYLFYHNKTLLESFAVKTTVPILNKSNFESVKFLIPPLKEQKRIASLLSAVQKAVEQQERLIALSSELKKALMHKLFTEGTRGEKQKQTEIGLVPESWEVVPLTSLIADRLQNGAFVKKPVIGKGFLFANVVDMYREIYLDYRQLTRIKVLEVEIDQYFLNEDDLLVVRSSLKREGIGQNCIVKALPERIFYDCHLIRVVPDTDKILPEFLSYFWRSSIGKADLIRRSKTTTMTTINQQSLGSALIPVPQRSEQQEIVECLLSCDANIMVHRELKNAFSILFRTLLHQLMTAQIRVNDLDLSALDYEPIAAEKEEVI